MKRKNMISMVTSLALVGVVAIGGTLALLTQPSNTVDNIFTVGKGYTASDIKLDEDKVHQVTEVENFGGYEGNNVAVAQRVTGNTYADLVVGTTLDKDPTFRIVEGATSPKSWFVAEVEGVTDNAGKLSVSGVEADNGWYEVSFEDGVYSYTPVTEGSQIKDDTYYIYDTAISAGQETDPLFTQLTVLAGAKGADVKKIVVSGTAVEAVGNVTFEDSRDAVMAAVGLK